MYQLKSDIRLYHEVVNHNRSHAQLANVIFFTSLKSIYTAKKDKEVTLHVFNTSNKSAIAKLLGMSSKQLTTKIDKLVADGLAFTYKKGKKKYFKLLSVDKAFDKLKFPRYTPLLASTKNNNRNNLTDNPTKGRHRYITLYDYDNTADLELTYLYKKYQQTAIRKDFRENQITNLGVSQSVAKRRKRNKEIATEGMIRVTVSIQKLADDLNLSAMKVHEMVETINRQLPGFRKKNIERIGFFDADDKKLKYLLWSNNQNGKSKAHYNSETKRLEVRHCNEYNIDTQRMPKLLKSNSFVEYRKEQRKMLKTTKRLTANAASVEPSTEITQGQLLFEEMLKNRKQLLKFGVITPASAKLKNGKYRRFAVREYDGIIARILQHPMLKEQFIAKFGGYIQVGTRKMWANVNSLDKPWVKFMGSGFQFSDCGNLTMDTLLRFKLSDPDVETIANMNRVYYNIRQHLLSINPLK